MTIYDFLKLAAQSHTDIVGGDKTDRLAFDLPGKSIRSGKLHILRGGQPTLRRVFLGNGVICDLDGLIDFKGDPYAEIERLYAQFKRSVPNRHERLNKGNFKALSSDALTMQELMENMPRVQARYEMEGFIVLASSAGLIPWRIPQHFFWASPEDPECIIYRNWILKEETA